MCGCRIQSCPTLNKTMDCSLPGSSVHGIFQARILKQVTMSYSKDLPNPGIESMSDAAEVSDGMFPYIHVEKPERNFLANPINWVTSLSP